jgi:hypothetical protein
VFRIFRCLSRVSDLLGFVIFGLDFQIVFPVEAAMGDCSADDIFCFDFEPLWQVHIKDAGLVYIRIDVDQSTCLITNV